MLSVTSQLRVLEENAKDIANEKQTLARNLINELQNLKSLLLNSRNHSDNIKAASKKIGSVIEDVTQYIKSTLQ